MATVETLKRVVRGGAMYHRVRVLNPKTSPARPYDPDAGSGAGVNSVRVSYFKPDGTVHASVNNVVMTKVAGIVGDYEFSYQSVVDDPLGVWAVQVKVTHQGFVTLEPKQNRFEVVP